MIRIKARINKNGRLRFVVIGLPFWKFRLRHRIMKWLNRPELVDGIMEDVAVAAKKVLLTGNVRSNI